MAKKICSICGKRIGILQTPTPYEGRIYCNACYQKTFERPGAAHPFPDDFWGKTTQVGPLLHRHHTLSLSNGRRRIHVLYVLEYNHLNPATAHLWGVEEYSGKPVDVRYEIDDDEGPTYLTLNELPYGDYLAGLPSLPPFAQHYLKDFSPGMPDFRSVYVPQDLNYYSCTLTVEGERDVEIFRCLGNYYEIFRYRIDRAVYDEWKKPFINLVELSDHLADLQLQRRILACNRRRILDQDRRQTLFSLQQRATDASPDAEGPEANLVYTQNYTTQLTQKHLSPEALKPLMEELHKYLS